MATNRYTNLSTSAYNPLSLQEIMLAPQMMRAKHDQLNADILSSQGLIKPDPLDVHLNEAMQLKNEYDTRLANQADILLKEGYNSNVLGQVRRMNRDVQNLMSPTGRIGQINAAKVAEAKAYKDWMDTEEAKKYGPAVANRRWLENRAKYTGYDRNRNIVNIGQMQAPVYEDLDKDIKDFLSNIGETTTATLRDFGASVQPQADGSVIFTDKQGKEINTTNFPQLQQALQRLNEKWVTLNSPGRLSADFRYQDPIYTANQIALGVNSALKTKNDKTQTISRSLQGYKNANEKDETSGNIYDYRPASTLNLQQALLRSGISKLGQETSIGGGSGSGISYGSSGGGMAPGYTGSGSSSRSVSTKIFTPDDLPVQERNEYNKIYNGLRENGTIPSNVSSKDPQAYKAVQEYIKNTATLTSQDVVNLGDVMTTYGDTSIGATKSNARVKVGEAIAATKRNRTYYDPKEDKFYSFDELPKEVKTAMSKVKSNGYVTPKNHLGTTVGKNMNKRMFGSPIIGEVELEDGETREFLISRTEGEMSTNSYKADLMFNDIWSNTNQRPGIYYEYKDKGQPTGLKIRSLGQNSEGQIMYEVKEGNRTGTATEEQLQNSIYAKFGVKN